MKGILLLGALGLIFVIQYQEAKAVATLADLENVVTLTAENFDEIFSQKLSQLTQESRLCSLSVKDRF